MKRVKRTCNVLARGCFETVWAKCRWIGHNRYWTKRSFLTEANVAKLFKCKLHLSLFNDILQHEPPLQASASLIPRVWISSYNQKYDLAGRKRLHIFSAVLGIQDVDLKFLNPSQKKNNSPSRKEWWIFLSQKQDNRKWRPKQENNYCKNDCSLLLPDYPQVFQSIPRLIWAME